MFYKIFSFFPPRKNNKEIININPVTIAAKRPFNIPYGDCNFGF